MQRREVKRIKMGNRREGWCGRRVEVNVFRAFFPLFLIKLT